ncbi:hypothetical protein GCM10023113_34430 [Cellulomonas oligotrophica]|uniref:Lipoprotein n=1 Tax=Cellulomonas oligotrophica TaxID=931536 RepID=A0ABQ4D682_9CELL|nr:hypothetical protein Col01nite_03860 [Cellulomonas oligotrophica]
MKAHPAARYGQAVPRSVRPVPLARRIVALGLAGMTLSACATPDADVEAVPPTAAAVEACLTAAAVHLDLPLDESDAVDIGVERDDQGWWAVRATVELATGARLLTCTAVPEDSPAGARAASFSVEDA